MLILSTILCINSASSLASDKTDKLYGKQHLNLLILNAEIKHQIPRGLLSAIAKTESDMQAYVLNVGGKSVKTKSVFEAEKIVQGYASAGISNIDLGVMQINWRWHKEKFKNIWDMLSPEQNIKYAAVLLKSLHKQYGSWEEAVRYYHSSDLDRQRVYSKKVLTCWLNQKKLSKLN